jgi:hypothetical protein
MISLKDLMARIKGMTPATKVLRPKGYKIICEIGHMIQDAAPTLTDTERRELADLWEETIAVMFDQSLSCIRVVRGREMYALTLQALKGDFPSSITYYGSEESFDGQKFLHPQGPANGVDRIADAHIRF